MKETDRPAFMRAMTELAETMGEPMSPGRVQGYWSALEDLPLADVLDGIQTALAECTDFFPKPGKIRQLADVPRGYQPGDGLLTPMPDFRPIEQRERLEGPVSLEKCLPAGEGIVAWRFKTKPYEPEPMKAEDVDARKAALREQARILKERGL